jgi:LDH2 family malate/lactate/ureidoglycolate dehydrogenase
MALAVAQARQFGVGAVTTYHHDHIGAAGIWTRMALEEDCIALAVSGHRFEPVPGEVVAAAATNSPISIAVPAGQEPPLVLDMGASFLPRTEELMAKFPQVFFKALGIGSANLALGGILAGTWRPESRPPDSRWTVNQGSFLTAWNVARFREPDSFKAEIDRHIRKVRALEPLPGFDQAELPGGMEFGWEQRHCQRGIPISDEHRGALNELAAEAGIEAPWQAHEHTRF